MHVVIFSQGEWDWTYILIYMFIHNTCEVLIASSFNFSHELLVGVCNSKEKEEVIVC